MRRVVCCPKILINAQHSDIFLKEENLYGVHSSGIVYFLFASLTVCGGDDDDGDQSPFQVVAGEWDTTDVEDGLEDINFTVIRADGTASGYDHRGDLFEHVADCYVKFDFALTHEGGSLFIVSTDGFEGCQRLDLSVQSGRLHFALLDEDDETDNFPRADLSEAEMVPLCDSGFSWEIAPRRVVVAQVSHPCRGLNF